MVHMAVAVGVVATIITVCMVAAMDLDIQLVVYIQGNYFYTYIQLFGKLVKKKTIK